MSTIMKIKKLNSDSPGIVLTITISEEDRGPEGCFDSGDDTWDKITCDQIRNELDKGNLWAWCYVAVNASYNGITGVAYLGACSYKDEADFKSEGGYYPQLVIEAVEALNSEIAATFEQLAPLLELENPNV